MNEIINTEREESKQTPNQDFERLCTRYKSRQIGYEELKIGMLLLHASNDFYITYNNIDQLAKELRDEQ